MGETVEAGSVTSLSKVQVSGRDEIQTIGADGEQLLMNMVPEQEEAALIAVAVDWTGD